MSINKMRYEDGREGWLALRDSMTDRVGGSQLGAINNHSPYTSFLKELRFAVGAEARPDISNKIAVMRGQYDEEFVAELFEKFSGLKVHKENCIYTNDKYPHLKSSIDRKVANRPAGLECKTINDFVMRQYDADEFPMAYWDQCVSYLATTELEDWYLALLTGGNEFKCFRMTRKPEVAARYAELKKKFALAVNAADPDAEEWNAEWAFLDAVYHVDETEIAACETRAAYFIGKVEQVNCMLAEFDKEHGDATEIERKAHLEACIEQVVETSDLKIRDSDDRKEQIDLLAPETVIDTEVRLDPESVNGKATKALLEEYKRLNAEIAEYAEAEEQKARENRVAEIEVTLAAQMGATETMYLPGENGAAWRITMKAPAPRRSAKVAEVEKYFKGQGVEIPEGIISVSEPTRSLKVAEVKPKAAKKTAVPKKAA